MFKNANVLVTGGTGMIGIPLVTMLLERGAKVRVVSLDDPSRSHPDAEFIRADLTELSTCLEICKGMDYVFHLAGTKGSPRMAATRPASFSVPMLMFNTNMMEAARRSDVDWYLYTSSVGVYAPAPLMTEDDVWRTFPSEHDRFAGWAKRLGELQAEAYDIEYGWRRISIVRPANVYGPNDNFDPASAMVIPSLIHRALEGERPLVVWGDGTPIRDFIHARDVAQGMLLAVEKKITEPMNLGSGVGISIKELVDIIVRNLEEPVDVVWDAAKGTGDQLRLLDTQRAQSYGFSPSISMEEGIADVISWYRRNSQEIHKRYNAFIEN